MRYRSSSSSKAPKGIHAMPAAGSATISSLEAPAIKSSIDPMQILYSRFKRSASAPPNASGDGASGEGTSGDGAFGDNASRDGSSGYGTSGELSSSASCFSKADLIPRGRQLRCWSDHPKSFLVTSTLLQVHEASRMA
eukprot:scaffold4640_cov263-Pinguiococcus_pyrenoidosus.AAC.2